MNRISKGAARPVSWIHRLPPESSRAAADVHPSPAIARPPSGQRMSGCDVPAATQRHCILLSHQQSQSTMQSTVVVQ